MAMAKIIACAFNDLMMAHYLRAAEVRQICAIVSASMETEGGNEPSPADTSRGAA